MKQLTIILLLLSVGMCPLVLAQGYSIGDEVADFTLMNVDNKMVSLHDYNENKGVVIIFTCNHCPYSVAYENRIEALNKKYKKLGFPIIAINSIDAITFPSDSFAKMKVKAEDKGFTFPYLVDNEQDVLPVFGAQKTPHTYLLDNKSGTLKVAYIGAIDNIARDESRVTKTYLSDAIDALLEGKIPNITKTKAVGCTIKVKK